MKKLLFISSLTLLVGLFTSFATAQAPANKPLWTREFKKVVKPVCAVMTGTENGLGGELEKNIALEAQKVLNVLQEQSTERLTSSYAISSVTNAISKSDSATIREICALVTISFDKNAPIAE